MTSLLIIPSLLTINNENFIIEIGIYTQRAINTLTIRKKVEALKKYALVIGATLVAGSFAWGAVEHQHSKDTETKVQQYESFLSVVVTNNNAKLFSDIQTLSSYVDNNIKNKKMEANEKSIVIGQLFELMDIVQQEEQLAVTTNAFENPSPSFQTANNLYVIGMYLTQIEPSKTLSSEQLEKLQTIQSFTTAWKQVADKHLSQLTTKDGFNEYYIKYEKTMMKESLWKEIINDMDKETSAVIKEKKILTLESYLMPESEKKGE